MAGTGTSPWLFSLTPSSPQSGLKGWTSNPHKRGLCTNRRAQTACKFSREDEGSREVDGLRSAQALVSFGFGPATSAMGRSAFLVGVASSPSGRGQTLPLQAQTRASGMIYNCSIRLERVLPDLRFPCKSQQNEEPTSGLEPLTCSLRVRRGMLPCLAEACKTRIPKPISFPRLAHHCGALRPR